MLPRAGTVQGEKCVKALFSLASKIAPTVIFIDEMDSMLSKRASSSSEHEAMRKIKNEFMSSWDGMKTRSEERVIVMGCTNRPQDLDEAVVRRLPRRLMVPLPNAENREKILRIQLKNEELAPATGEDAVLSIGRTLVSRSAGVTPRDNSTLRPRSASLAGAELHGSHANESTRPRCCAATC